MKYKLLKDLPFAKAGDDRVRISENFGGDHFIVVAHDANNTRYECAIPINNAHLWIEEVKPREGLLCEDNDGAYKFFYQGAKPKESWDKTTKWIEVIE